MKKTILEFDLNKKIVILRCDLNVSIKDNKIIDDTRIKESIKTIKYILDNNAKVVILSHLGKIKTEEDKLVNNLDLVYDCLNKLLPNKITFIPFTRNEIIKKTIDNISYGQGVLLQNTRFEDLDNKKESGNDLELAKYWASLGDIFINDAFATLHRKHASNYGISSFLDTGIGFLIMKELEELDKLDNPKRLYSVIMGGSKISDKLEIIKSLIIKVDKLFIGGAMAFTFLKAQGYNIGLSLYEKEYVSYCKELLKKYSDKIILPIDFKGEEKGKISIKDIDKFTNNFKGLDIGNKTITLFSEKLNKTKTIFWNGPLGMYEEKEYQEGTKQILKYITTNIETTILGGGDIVGCANILGYKDKVTFASTGGGASLEYLENKNLPGLINIKDSNCNE